MVCVIVPVQCFCFGKIALLKTRSRLLAFCWPAAGLRPGSPANSLGKGSWRQAQAILSCTGPLLPNPMGLHYTPQHGQILKKISLNVVKPQRSALGHIMSLLLSINACCSWGHGATHPSHWTNNVLNPWTGDTMAVKSLIRLVFETQVGNVANQLQCFRMAGLTFNKKMQGQLCARKFPHPPHFHLLPIPNLGKTPLLVVH